MGKTPPLLMFRREAVCNIWSHALEFLWVSLPPCYGQESSGLQHLESCTGVLLGKIPPLLMVSGEVVCNICSHAPEFGCI